MDLPISSDGNDPDWRADPYSICYANTKHLKTNASHVTPWSDSLHLPLLPAGPVKSLLLL